MTEKDVVDVLNGCGWKCKKDEVGDFFCIKKIKEFQIQVIPSLKERVDHFRFSLMSSLSRADFVAAENAITGGKVEHVPVVVGNFPVRKIPVFSRQNILDEIDFVQSWALGQSVEEGLEMYRNLPTDAKGAYPLRHLAALALNRNVDVLRKYLYSFENGDRLGFVPYISEEMVRNALVWAQREL